MRGTTTLLSWRKRRIALRTRLLRKLPRLLTGLPSAVLVSLPAKSPVDVSDVRRLAWARSPSRSRRTHPVSLTCVLNAGERPTLGRLDDGRPDQAWRLCGSSPECRAFPSHRSPSHEAVQVRCGPVERGALNAPLSEHKHY